METQQPQTQVAVPSKADTLSKLKAAYPTETELISTAWTTAEKFSNDNIIKSNLAAARMQAEIYYGNGNSYGTAGNSCFAAVFSDTTIAKAIVDAKAANGGTNLVCNNSMTAYAISSKMVADPTHYWCVDSIGAASKSTTALGTNTVCPTAN